MADCSDMRDWSEDDDSGRDVSNLLNDDPHERPPTVLHGAELDDAFETPALPQPRRRVYCGRGRPPKNCIRAAEKSGEPANSALPEKIGNDDVQHRANVPATETEPLSKLTSLPIVSQERDAKPNTMETAAVATELPPALTASDPKPCAACRSARKRPLLTEAEKEQHKRQRANDRSIAAAAKKVAKQREDEVNKVRSLGVTAALRKRNVPDDSLQRMQTAADSNPNILALLAGLEKGGKLQHEHLQMAVQVKGFKDAAQFTKWLKKELGWTDNKDFNVKTRSLTDKDGDTFEFQIGYCMKDLGKDHFRCAIKNITDDMVQQGFLEYLLRGAEAEIKEKIVLDDKNLFQKAAQYYKMKTRYKAKPEVLALQHVVLAMIRSGRYLICPKMIEKGTGGGFDPKRAEALWRITYEPHQASLADVTDIIFAYVQIGRGLLGRYFDGDEQEDLSWELDDDQLPTLQMLQGFTVSRLPSARAADVAGLQPVAPAPPFVVAKTRNNPAPAAAALAAAPPNRPAAAPADAPSSERFSFPVDTNDESQEEDSDPEANPMETLAQWQSRNQLPAGVLQIVKKAVAELNAKRCPKKPDPGPVEDFIPLQ